MSRSIRPVSTSSAISQAVTALKEMVPPFCQQPSMDVQIARDSEYVRSFLLRDGRLYLDLMADGGQYVWEPIGR